MQSLPIRDGLFFSLVYFLLSPISLAHDFLHHSLALRLRVDIFLRSKSLAARFLI
jgi:hypothetical protein